MTAPAAVREIRVGVADHAVGAGEARITTVGLGSCVAIVMYDASARVGGLAHVLLPVASAGRVPGGPARYASTAVPMMLAELRAAGAGRRVTAKLVGGASMFAALLPAGGVNMGERNVEAALQALARAGLPLVGRDTGGDHGRSVSLDLATGRVDVRSLKRGALVL